VLILALTQGIHSSRFLWKIPVKAADHKSQSREIQASSSPNPHRFPVPLSFNPLARLLPSPAPPPISLTPTCFFLRLLFFPSGRAWRWVRARDRWRGCSGGGRVWEQGAVGAGCGAGGHHCWRRRSEPRGSRLSGPGGAHAGEGQKVDERATARVASSPIFLWRREGRNSSCPPQVSRASALPNSRDMEAM
jgi:hypothetical protein